MYRFCFLFINISLAFGQQDARMYDIIEAVSANRIITDVETLANFGTRDMDRTKPLGGLDVLQREMGGGISRLVVVTLSILSQPDLNSSRLI